jgi:hypothetical protein
VNDFFKSHGIKSPSSYLAHRAGLTRTQIYFIYGYAEKGIGSGKGQLDPKTACFLIMQADAVLTETERFEPTPIENFLRPRLEKFYNRKEKKSK